MQDAKTPARRRAAPRSEVATQQVDALAHGLAVLESWEDGDTWLCNSTIAERSGLARPTVSRLASALVDLGYLIRDPKRRGSFRLASATLHLGFGSALGCQAASYVLPELSRLSNELNVYAALGIRRSDQIQILENVVSPQNPNAVNVDVGTLLPICRSVAGLAALSALPAREAWAVVEPLKPQYGEQWRNLDHHLNRSRLEFAAKGYCTAVAILSEHVGAVAVPIHTPGRESTFVLACGMPAREFCSERVERSIAPRMLNLVGSLANALC